MTNLAPLVVTAYNRPDNLSSLLGSLISNPESIESDLYLFIDGPKNRFDADLIQQVNSNAKIFKSYFKSFNIFQNEKNLGCRSQIINAGKFIFQSKKAAIFVEDDLILSSTFLRFMNESLFRFEKDLRIGCITGHYVAGNELVKGLKLCSLANYGHNLGWATWRREWDSNNFDPQKQLTTISNMHSEWLFDRNGFYPFTKKLEKEAKDPGRSWAILWLAHCFITNKLTVFPSKNMVLHSGVGANATNYTFKFQDPLLAHLNFLTKDEVFDILESKEILDCEAEFKIFLKNCSNTNNLYRLKAYLTLKIKKYRSDFLSERIN